MSVTLNKSNYLWLNLEEFSIRWSKFSYEKAVSGWVLSLRERKKKSEQNLIDNEADIWRQIFETKTETKFLVNKNI